MPADSVPSQGNSGHATSTLGIDNFANCSPDFEVGVGSLCWNCPTRRISRLSNRD